MQLDIAKLEQVVEAAKARAANHPRWIAAIERAAEELMNNPYISEQDGGLLISPRKRKSSWSARRRWRCRGVLVGRQKPNGAPTRTV
jgi:hypothetical protein